MPLFITLKKGAIIMNYILILIIVLPILALALWMDSINRKYSNKIKDLKHLIYSVHDEVSELKREKRQSDRYKK
jgi:uncharacterized protein YoxC